MKESRNTLIKTQWSSKWAFILAATGAAVGLGNVWRFPYMAGTNGGSAFVILYLACVLLIGLPIMISEILIGRQSRQDAVSALENLAAQCHHKKSWKWLGWWGAVALILVLSFYSVVSGWSIAYFFRALNGHFAGLTAEAIEQNWQYFLSNPWRLIAWHTLFMSLTIGVTVKGVQDGLERTTKYLTPTLFLILFILVAYAGLEGAFRHTLHFLFDFKIEKITPAIIIAAMGHAFLTLALGGGAMLTYGAYVPKRVNLAFSVSIVALLDLLVATLSGLAIFPLVFAYHIAPTSGPGLMFVALPLAFAHIPAGAIIGALFFLLLLFAAWTSSINLAEAPTVILMNRFNMSRKKSALMIGGIAWFIGLGSALSFNVWRNVKLFHQFTLFDLATNIPTDLLLPIGGLGFSIFAGWVMTKKMSQQEVSPGIYRIWLLLTRYWVPIAIILIFITPFIRHP